MVMPYPEIRILRVRQVWHLTLKITHSTRDSCEHNTKRPTQLDKPLKASREES